MKNIKNIRKVAKYISILTVVLTLFTNTANVVPIPVAQAAVITHIATTQTIDTDGNATVTTGSFTPTAGDLIIVSAVGWVNPTAPDVSTVKLDGVTSFAIDKAINDGTSSFSLTIASLPNVAAGSHTVTVTFASNATQAFVYVSEYAGAALTSVADGTGSTNTGNNSNASSGTFTTTNSNDLWVGVTANDDGANPATMTQGASWTIPANGSIVNGSANRVSSMEYQIVSSSTSGAATWTNSATVHWVAAAMTYKVAPVNAASVTHVRLSLLRKMFRIVGKGGIVRSH